MTRVLVLVDHAGGVAHASARELLTAARDLGEPAAVWLGPGQVPLGELAEYGAAEVWQLETPGVPERLSAVAAEALTALTRDLRPLAVLLASTFENKEIAARLALATDSGVVTDARGVQLLDGQLLVTKDDFGASWSVDLRIVTPLGIVALRPNSVEPLARLAGPVELTRCTMTPSERAGAVSLLERTERPRGGRPELTEAQIVVVGGRGTEGDFAPVEELADALGAAVGATRVVTDEGWVDHALLVGQTGASIAPRLYVGAGVSGAVHHVGGMSGSGLVVAVCDDPEAPIFEMADFGVVGDLFEVLPEATRALAELRGQSAGD